MIRVEALITSLKILIVRVKMVLTVIKIEESKKIKESRKIMMMISLILQMTQLKYFQEVNPIKIETEPRYNKNT